MQLGRDITLPKPYFDRHRAALFVVPGKSCSACCSPRTRKAAPFVSYVSGLKTPCALCCSRQTGTGALCTFFCPTWCSVGASPSTRLSRSPVVGCRLVQIASSLPVQSTSCVQSWCKLTEWQNSWKAVLPDLKEFMGNSEQQEGCLGAISRRESQNPAEMTSSRED